MGPINSLNGTSKTLRAPFDAFKFPNSDVVQFKALVTPCMPTCNPVVCDVQDYLGYQRKIESLGKRRRRRHETAQEPGNLLVVQSIRIADKFQAVAPTAETEVRKSRIDSTGAESEVAVLTGPSDNSSSVTSPPCLNLLGLLMAGALFLVAQAVLIGAWAFIWQKRRQSKLSETCSPSPQDERDRRFYAAQFANGSFVSS